METKYKPKDTPDEYLKFGVYFKSESDISKQYLVEFCAGRFEGNALVKIFSTDILDNHFNTDGLLNGNNIGVYEPHTKWICEVDFGSKYFFPKFKNDMQLYYDDEKYYGGKCKTNSITSLMECVNFAIEYGLNESGIKPS